MDIGSFGGGFGANPAQPQQQTGFGGFGSTTGGSLFGAPTTTSAAPSFNFPSFGATSTSTAPSLFSGFGQATQSSGEENVPLMSFAIFDIFIYMCYLFIFT